MVTRRGLFFKFNLYILTTIAMGVGVWLSDRPRTQQRLVLDLAGLLDSMETKNVGLFLEAFWTTISREWNGVDVLRMDKFLLLVRGYLASSFRYLHARKWEKELVGRFMGLLRETPLRFVFTLAFSFLLTPPMPLCYSY